MCVEIIVLKVVHNLVSENKFIANGYSLFFDSLDIDSRMSYGSIKYYAIKLAKSLSKEIYLFGYIINSNVWILAEGGRQGDKTQNNLKT